MSLGQYANAINSISGRLQAHLASFLYNLGIIFLVLALTSTILYICTRFLFCCCGKGWVEYLYSVGKYSKIFRPDTTIFINEVGRNLCVELRCRPNRIIFGIREGNSFLPLCNPSFRKAFDLKNADCRFSTYTYPAENVTKQIYKHNKKTTYLLTKGNNPASLKSLAGASVTHTHLMYIYRHPERYPTIFRYLVTNWKSVNLLIPTETRLLRNCKHYTCEFH
jgi:hypothetical protein